MICILKGDSSMSIEFMEAAGGVLVRRQESYGFGRLLTKFPVYETCGRIKLIELLTIYWNTQRVI